MSQYIDIEYIKGVNLSDKIERASIKSIRFCLTQISETAVTNSNAPLASSAFDFVTRVFKTVVTNLIVFVAPSTSA